jgi:hypothetical protein
MAHLTEKVEEFSVRRSTLASRVARIRTPQRAKKADRSASSADILQGLTGSVAGGPSAASALCPFFYTNFYGYCHIHVTRSRQALNRS